MARAAVSIDNARRYTREHAVAVTLQRSLLPRALPEQSALDVGYRYLPAQSGVSGDWFNVMPCRGAGWRWPSATWSATACTPPPRWGGCGPRCTTSPPWMPPDELLGISDDLVGRVDQDEQDTDGAAGVVGATCLYAIYDPVTRRCVMARAGHLAPALVHPDGTVTFVDVPTGPPLGLGSLPSRPPNWTSRRALSSTSCTPTAWSDRRTRRTWAWNCCATRWRATPTGRPRRAARPC